VLTGAETASGEWSGKGNRHRRLPDFKSAF
jgi:hypothetical protein